MSVAEAIILMLINDDWNITEFSDGTFAYSKRIENYEEAGQLSNGARVVKVRLDRSYRWFERVDGWGYVQKDLDLRLYCGDDVESEAKAAIADLLNKDKMVGRRA